MVFGVVTINGDVMPLIISSHFFRVNMVTYVKFVEEVVLCWTKRVVLSANKTHK